MSERYPDPLSPMWSVPVSAAAPRSRQISPAMLAAGRSAFLEKREMLDDLTDFYQSDLDEFLSEIYRKMAGEA